MITSRKPIFRSIAVALAIFGVSSPCLFWPGTGFAAELIWTGDFETGDFSQYRDHLYGLGILSSKKLVTSPVRAGRYATALTILDSDPSSGTQRAELISRDGSGSSIDFDWDGPEYWIGFSFLFKEWSGDAWTLFQLHAPNEPKGDNCDYAGNTFSIYENTDDSNGTTAHNIDIHIIEHGGVSRGKGAGSNSTVVYSYPLPENEWQDYIVNFRLSTKGDGFYHVWKNGKEIYSKTGLTNVNYMDSCGNPIPESQTAHNGVHIGVYGPSSAVLRRIYYDEVRVAQGSNGYDLVAPGPSELLIPAEPEESLPKPPVIVEN